MDELQELINDKLHSQYLSYRGIVSGLYIKAKKAWIEQECTRQIDVMTHSVDKLLLEVTHWKKAHEASVLDVIALKIKLKNTENDNTPPTIGPVTHGK